ncbi:MAG: bifunctional folylpolyglutamate synthase/dihydrofolate synthase [Chloroflexi bacterium]|nr:bifunctional folylpolyglutamate synthase/dihydrofolate synthase [Chloroflexota bacterium]
MIDADFQRALDFIYSFIDYERQSRPHEPARYDLRRVFKMLALLGNPHLKARTVHIAGTKGKGSTAAMIASVLTACGYRTGLYTSPHLHAFNERIRIDGNLISDEEIVMGVTKLKPVVQAINEEAAYGRLTTFEVITALGFDYFGSHGVDFQVVEVGMGGRLDATNVVHPDICVITSISLDHTEVLGDTLPRIAAEKAGIIKPDSIVVSSPQQEEEAAQVIEQVSAANKARMIRVGQDVTWEALGFNAREQSLRVRGRLGSYELTIPLLGEYQLENTATAVAALEVLAEKGIPISGEMMANGLAEVSWPGRLQVLNRRPLVVADGAHNPYSAQKLREALRQYFKFERSVLILGLSSDKDVDGIISELMPLFDKVIATHSVHPRALPTATLVARLGQHGVEALATEDISVALPLALSMAGEQDIICVTGSLFVVAGAIEQARTLCLTAE